MNSVALSDTALRLWDVLHRNSVCRAPRTLRGAVRVRDSVQIVGRVNVPPRGSEQRTAEAEVFDWNGGPCRDRTYDQEIKSLLLYQLS